MAPSLNDIDDLPPVDFDGVDTSAARAGSGGGGRGSGGGGGGGGGGISGGAGRGSRGYVPLSSGYAGGRGASNGPGGGPIGTIGAGFPFAGRQVGGGTRGQVIGSPRYGSGYPYGGSGSYVTSRPFPFGFWPVFIFPAAIGGGYYGNHIYGPAHNDSRPGGIMQQSEVTSNTWPALASSQTNPNATAPYWIIGDEQSLLAVGPPLAESCNANIGTPVNISDDGSNALKPEQIVAYYRASSFALALTSYWNPASSIANQPATNDSALPDIPDAPWPPGTDLDFMSCLNSVIIQELPILDASSATRLQVSSFGYLALLWVLLSTVGLI